MFSRYSLNLEHGPKSPTCVPPAQECLETRPKESKHVCKFLGSLTRLEPTAIGGELWIACEGTGFSRFGAKTACSVVEVSGFLRTYGCAVAWRTIAVLCRQKLHIQRTRLSAPCRERLTGAGVDQLAFMWRETSLSTEQHQLRTAEASAPETVWPQSLGPLFHRPTVEAMRRLLSSFRARIGLEYDAVPPRTLKQLLDKGIENLDRPHHAHRG